jgi:hypothetical protein
MTTNNIYMRNIIEDRIVNIIPETRRNQQLIYIAQEIFNFVPDYIIRQGGEILDINTNIDDINIGDNIYVIRNVDIHRNENIHNENYEDEMNILFDMGIANNSNNENILNMLIENNGNIQLIIDIMFSVELN